MANRKILYGYQITHGELVIRAEEQLIVHKVFITYLTGLSYQALADQLNADNIPFAQESPLWNKHKIKRMLENRPGHLPASAGKDSRKDKRAASAPNKGGSSVAKAAQRMLSGPPVPDWRARRSQRANPPEMFRMRKRIYDWKGGTACAGSTAACSA